ncbi:MAG: 1-deoxy-D-xylulose-5-phosphate reductoisomerase [Dehalococcoidales bacterium]|nr:1-deoxy-D-xylulose-5-phosphate reductoisomerase [Dehalococcoidales bacterium]
MGDSIKRLAVLGSTGSIGKQTLDVVRSLPDRFKITGLAAGNNIQLLNKQIEEFKPEYIYYCGADKTKYKNQRFINMEEMVSLSDVDIVVVATPGGSGLSPTLAAVKAGKKVALSNKESLVSAGKIIMEEAALNNATIIPVDSEHSAIWQCFEGESKKCARIILTASGGPFRGYLKSRLDEVTPEQALKHPSWKMGRKVTIDSATLLNKGLEVIEAHWLFGMPYENIRVIIHPQSIIHSMIEFPDGSIKAQLGYPDMRLPIQYALTYPERIDNQEIPRLDWNALVKLDFEQPDLDTFPCLRLAIEAGKEGGTAPVALCAADEVAVELFLSHRIKFNSIAKLIEKVLKQHRNIKQPTLEDIYSVGSWARVQALELATGVN